MGEQNSGGAFEVTTAIEKTWKQQRESKIKENSGPPSSFLSHPLAR